jgi:hypothetical protein
MVNFLSGDSPRGNSKIFDRCEWPGNSPAGNFPRGNSTTFDRCKWTDNSPTGYSHFHVQRACRSSCNVPVIVKMAVFWVVVLCSLVEVYLVAPCSLVEGATTQKTAIFILTAVRTSNPTARYCCSILTKIELARLFSRKTPQYLI